MPTYSKKCMLKVMKYLLANTDGSLRRVFLFEIESTWLCIYILHLFSKMLAVKDDNNECKLSGRKRKEREDVSAPGEHPPIKKVKPVSKHFVLS